MMWSAPADWERKRPRLLFSVRADELIASEDACAPISRRTPNSSSISNSLASNCSARVRRERSDEVISQNRLNRFSPPASSEVDLGDQLRLEFSEFRRNVKMKTLVSRSLLLALTMAACAFGAVAGEKGRDRRTDRRDIRQDTRDIRHDRRDINQDVRERRADVRDYRQDKKEGDSQAVLRADRQEIVGDTKDIRADRRDLRSDLRDRRRDIRDRREDRKEPN